MQKKNMKKRLTLVLCLAFIMAMTVQMTGCGSKEKESTGTESDVRKDGGVLGEGSTEFPFTVVDKEGKETSFEIHTDKETVGEALEELGLIAGEESEYGLYVKTVNGITLDYDTDGMYWAFYINEEYASAGVDSTAITKGDSYTFKAEKE